MINVWWLMVLVPVSMVIGVLLFFAVCLLAVAIMEAREARYEVTQAAIDDKLPTIEAPSILHLTGASVTDGNNKR